MGNQRRLAPFAGNAAPGSPLRLSAVEIHHAAVLEDVERRSGLLREPARTSHSAFKSPRRSREIVIRQCGPPLPHRS